MSETGYTPIDPDDIYRNQKVAEKKFEGLSTDEYNHLRRMAKVNLFFLATGVLGYNKLSPNLHGHLCRWMYDTRERQFREILLPRGHYKSTIATISDSVQIILPDVSGVAEWPRNLGTNCRLLICHETHDSAARFLYSVQSHFMSNPTLMGLFPECVPNPRKHRINRYELELPRTEIWSEPTIDTMGVGGRNQGRHYNYIKFDDLIGDKARDSATEMQAAKDWFDNVQSFFSTFAKDKFDLIGTRWAFDDLYSHVHKNYGDLLTKYIRGVEERDPKTGERRTIFPEEFPIEKLQILRLNRKVFSAQYANDPAEGASEFDQSWKRFYNWYGVNRVVLNKGEEKEIINCRDLDIVTLIDPAMQGNAGFIVTGVDHKNRVFVLDAQKREWKPPELVDLLFKSVMRWQPRVVGIENVLFSGLFQHWLDREMSVRGIRFAIVPLKTGNKQKEARVRGLANYFSAGQIYFNLGQQDLIEEFDTFGASEDIHMLDALAYGPELWKPGLSPDKWKKYKEAELNLLKGRDVHTGYSEI